MGGCKLSTTAKPISEISNKKEKNQIKIDIKALGEISTLIFIISKRAALQVKAKGIYITNSDNTALKGITA